MQFKSITAIAVLLLVVASLLVAGCTTTTNTNNPSSTGMKSNGKTVSQSEFANLITQHLKDQGVDVVTPFAYAGTVNGSQTYKGVIKDGSSKLQVFNREITYTLSDTREDAKAAFSQAITAATNNGYQNNIPSFDISKNDVWAGLYGGKNDGTVGSKVVLIGICEPKSNCGLFTYTMSFSDYFSITTEYQTRIE